MADFNRVVLMGNMTRDPVLSYTPSNVAVCEIGLAVNRKWKDRDGNQKEEVCFVDCVAYGGTGEVIHRYLGKGKPILIEGRLRYREWTSKEGQKRSKLEVLVESFTFVGGGQGGNGGQDYRGGSGGAARQPASPPPAPAPDPAPSGAPASGPMDHDIPF
jgi:single-strand DNA-binding protein